MKLSPLFTTLVLALSMRPCMALAATGTSIVSGLSMSASHQDSIVRFNEENRRIAIEQLSRKHIGIELLTAGSSGAEASSLFGHSLIRLIDEDSDPLNDTIIGFEMLSLGNGDDVAKGVFGGDRTVPRVMTMATFLVRYGLNEGRSLNRVILPSTPESIARLKHTILNILSVPDIVGDYKFFSNNCLTALRNVLGSAGYPMPNGLIDIPTGFSQALQTSMETYAPPIPLPSVYDILWNRLCDYWQAEKGIGSCALHIDKWKIQNRSFTADGLLRESLGDAGFWKFLEKGPADENSLLVHLWPYGLDSQTDSKTIVSADIMGRLQVLKANTPGFLPIEQIFKTLPPAVYRLCSLQDEQCRAERMKAALTVWDAKTLSDVSQYYEGRARSELKRAHDLVPWAEKAIERWLNSPVVQDMTRVQRDLKIQTNGDMK